MKRVAVLMAAVGILMLTTQAAFAGSYPPGPACAKSQGQGTDQGTHAGNSGQPCQTPPGQAKKANFQFPRASRQGGVTVGVVVIAGLAGFTLLFAARGVRRRLVS